MRRPALVVIWLLATSATTAVAFWAVSSANSEVSQRPLTAVVASAPAPTSVTSAPTTTLVTSTLTTPISTTTDAAISPTSAAPAEWTQTTVNSDGGSIIVSYRPSEVRLESVAPRAGFTFEIDDEGPDRVRVEFFGEEVTYTLRAQWTDEGFVTEVDSSGEGSGG